ncbi:MULTISPECIES: M23 family metallopeptidase [unclassified Pseudoalteromonas]|uniref:M23 family metallopeptidase n=1 Tax=unclassified Pseudoalteromonas TaxID=194690 RepID=UPI0020986551|nr:M23 family metallopeptidase [Pseudoalteromonas sp. XMcav2-N]MCO7190282.1 M23 family metallopeptidase [Pseudoalteromonas sp. XMcav2-N]
MFRYIKRLITSLFQPKQLMMRQNGQVSMMVVPGWLQFIALVLVCGALTWLVISTSAFFKQQKTVNALQAELQTQQRAWAKEKQLLAERLTEQHTQLVTLNEQHTVLSEIVGALPTSITEQADTPAPLPDTDNRVDVDPTVNDAHEFEVHSAELDDAQAALLRTLQTIISARNDQLMAGFNEAGLSLTTDNNTAQGGPYHQVDATLLNAHYTRLIDDSVQLNQLENLLHSTPKMMPVAHDKYYISSAFGFRKDPITGRRAYHKGVDMAGWHKTQIIAPADGVVSKAGKNGGYGKFIEIQHANGIVTRYGHLHTIKVKKGQSVKQSDVIALMGSTGRSTSTHLHYEVLQDKKHINPVKLARVLKRVQ